MQVARCSPYQGKRSGPRNHLDSWIASSRQEVRILDLDFISHGCQTCLDLKFWIQSVWSSTRSGWAWAPANHEDHSQHEEAWHGQPGSLPTSPGGKPAISIQRIVIVCGAGGFLDGYDLLMMSAALLLLVPRFGPSSGQTG